MLKQKLNKQTKIAFEPVCLILIVNCNNTKVFLKCTHLYNKIGQLWTKWHR